jgi:hypothetical protein
MGVLNPRRRWGSPVLIESALDAVRKWRFEAGPEEPAETIQVTFEPELTTNVRAGDLHHG